MQRTREISKSMMSYLKRAREHQEFLLRQTKEFERGKRHLANMMGIRHDEMTQADIDAAIKYLFPTGLFDKRAWPIMQHPSKVFVAQKKAQFDVEGRPYHFLFYTTLPNYNESLSQLRENIAQLNEYEDKQLARGVINPPDNSQYNNSGRKWLSLDQLRDKFLEKIKLQDYEVFINALQHLIEHPYSNRVKEFVDDFSIELPDQAIELDLPEIQRDEATGQIYTVREIHKHNTYLKIKTVLNGTGKVLIGEKDILFFPDVYMRKAILFPLQISEMVDKVDIEVEILKYELFFAYSGAAECIRYAVATSIAAYGDDNLKEKMRLAGLLTKDKRTRERKKVNKDGARAGKTWKKR